MDRERGEGRAARSRDGGDASASQETPKGCCDHQKLGRTDGAETPSEPPD